MQSIKYIHKYVYHTGVYIHLIYIYIDTYALTCIYNHFCIRTLIYTYLVSTEENRKKEERQLQQEVALTTYDYHNIINLLS